MSHSGQRSRWEGSQQPPFYIRSHQDSLRAEMYQELASTVADPSYSRGHSKVGKRVVLPSSYAGSPRAMRQKYLDAMAIVRKHGRPDLFITMTANPTWPEIAENLRPWESAAERPDLVAHVFKMKFDALLTDLLQRSALGKVVAYTWVIDFQK